MLRSGRIVLVSLHLCFWLSCRLSNTVRTDTATNLKVATRSGAILQTHPPPTAAGQVLLHAMPQAQLAAVATGFIALTSSAPSPEAVSTVYAWGDPRYPKLLGRSGDDSDGTTDVPRPVPGLSDLPTGPVVKIAAGNGYFAAALTKGGDLYAWGVGIAGRPARRKLGGPEEDDGADGGGGECALWAGLSEIPEPVVVVDPESGEEEQDVLDVGVGEAHAIVLCGSGDVYVVGDNDNGQLGLGKDIRYVSSWRKIRLPERRKAVAVAAGPRSSFIITQNEEPQEKH